MNQLAAEPLEIRDQADLTGLATWGMILLHMSILLVFLTGVSWPAVVACLATYWMRVLGITVGYHRCLSHRTFETSRKFQFFLAWLGASTLQRGPLWFAAHHRRHHKYADTEHDLHSPVSGTFWWAHIGWILCSKFNKADFSLIPDLARYRELRWMDRNFLLPPLTLALMLAIAGAVLPGTSPLQMLVWGFGISTILVYHATFAVNSFAHRYGKRPFMTRDQSRNHAFLVIAMLGEGWHNNHHRFPNSARFALEPGQIDPGYWVVRALEKCGLIWDVKIRETKAAGKLV